MPRKYTPVTACFLCASPATEIIDGFDLCDRHATNLHAVLHGDLTLPNTRPRPRSVQRPELARQSAVLAELRGGARTMPDLAGRLGWALETTRNVVRRLHRDGRVTPTRGLRSAGRLSRPLIVWQLASAAPQQGAA